MVTAQRQLSVFPGQSWTRDTRGGALEAVGCGRPGQQGARDPDEPRFGAAEPLGPVGPS